jgi:hypothetical protein
MPSKFGAKFIVLSLSEVVIDIYRLIKSVLIPKLLYNLSSVPPAKSIFPNKIQDV